MLRVVDVGILDVVDMVALQRSWLRSTNLDAAKIRRDLGAVKIKVDAAQIGGHIGGR